MTLSAPPWRSSTRPAVCRRSTCWRSQLGVTKGFNARTDGGRHTSRKHAEQLLLALSVQAVEDPLPSSSFARHLHSPPLQPLAHAQSTAVIASARLGEGSQRLGAGLARLRNHRQQMAVAIPRTGKYVDQL